MKVGAVNFLILDSCVRFRPTDLDLWVVKTDSFDNIFCVLAISIEIIGKSLKPAKILING